MKIYDKAEWQIDNGVDESVVLNHFQFVFEWLNSNKLLSKDGLEILEIGIDEEVSLNEELLTTKGNEFLDKYYDALISKSEYDIEIENKLINEYWDEFCW